MGEPAPTHETVEFDLGTLRSRIEAMFAKVVIGRPEPFDCFTIANGCVKPEGELARRFNGSVAADTLATIGRLFPQASEQTLFWVRLPTLTAFSANGGGEWGSPTPANAVIHMRVAAQEQANG